MCEEPKLITMESVGLNMYAQAVYVLFQSGPYSVNTGSGDYGLAGICALQEVPMCSSIKPRNCALVYP